MFIRDNLATLRQTIDEAQKIVVCTGDPRTRTAVDLLDSAISQIDSMMESPKAGNLRRKGIVRVKA